MFEPREESKALHHRGVWPRPLSNDELTKVKLAIAARDGFPTDSENSFDRTSEEWIDMESAMAESHIFAIRSEVFEQSVIRIFIVAQSNVLILLVLKANDEELGNLEVEYESV